jgi:Tfp pilus assembly protein PilZ
MIMLFSVHIYALSDISSLSKNEKKLIERVLTTLKISLTEKNKETIYARLKPFLDNGDWSVRWTTNSTGSASRVENADTQICDLMIYNDNRVVNNTFVYFSKQKQLFINTKEFVEASSKDVLKYFKEIKNDPKYEKKAESENFAYFNEKGYMDYTVFHVKSPVGMIVYESSLFIDIK